MSVRICEVTGEYVMFFEGAEYMHAQLIQSYVIPQTRVRKLFVTQELIFKPHNLDESNTRGDGLSNFQTRLTNNYCKEAQITRV